ncbi:MAG: hypothetical protein HFG87_09135 [Dorea sp.]|nr:hypothetical protein [Dorea sp.]
MRNYRRKKQVDHMNFNDKKTRRIIAILIIVVIIAMIGTSIIPYLVV